MNVYTGMYVCTYACMYACTIYIANFSKWKTFAVAKLNCNSLENIHGWMVVLYGVHSNFKKPGAHQPHGFKMAKTT